MVGLSTRVGESVTTASRLGLPAVKFFNIVFLIFRIIDLKLKEHYLFTLAFLVIFISSLFRYISVLLISG